MGKFLSAKQREELIELHRYERERRYADRIKALLLWDSGWTLPQISEALLLDEKSVRRYRKLYEEDGADRLLNDAWRGSERRLTPKQEEKLRDHLDKHVYGSTKEIAAYVMREFGVEYTMRGIYEVLYPPRMKMSGNKPWELTPFFLRHSPRWKGLIGLTTFCGGYLLSLRGIQPTNENASKSVAAWQYFSGHFHLVAV